jgi:amino acid transporter/mannitol/fructose-specific phosphotransferase system IIA component (Ntr-type)
MSDRKLHRELRLIDVFSIAAGAMISSGIFVLPGIAHAKAGPSVILSYLIAGILAGIGMLNTAELATAMPKAGGDYFFITRTLGPAIGSVSGLLNWFALSLKSAFALVGIAAFVRLFVAVDMRLVGALLALIFVLINVAGSKHVGRLQVIFVSGLLLLMFYYIVKGIPRVQLHNLTPFVPFGFHKTLTTAGFVFVAYGGLLKITGVAEEVRNPAKTLPRGLFLALITVMILYALMVFVTTGVLPSEVLDNSLTPITDGARQFMGAWGLRAVGLAAILAFVSTANAGIMAASRYLFALSRDELLPGVLGHLSPKAGVPVTAIFCTGTFIIAALFLKLDILVKAASLVLILGFIFANVNVIVLRESHIQNYQPSFRAPFYPYLQIIGLLGFGLLIFELGLPAYLISALLFAVGLLIYILYGRKREARDYALLHLVERITDRKLVTGNLALELKQIIRERDEWVSDRFDQLIDRAIVLDLPGTDTEKLFRLVSEPLAQRLGMEPRELLRQFLQRETESSTALTPFLAIPHIIVPGTKHFEIMLVRSCVGIRFSESSPSVKALFILVGTADERNFHLQALASVAQIVLAPDFLKKWLNARDTEGLRDIIHLGNRLRLEGQLRECQELQLPPEECPPMDSDKLT